MDGEGACFICFGRRLSASSGGIIVTMLLGIAGALVAGWLGQLIGWYKEGQSAGFIASLLGALLLLFVYRLFKGRSATT